MTDPLTQTPAPRDTTPPDRPAPAANRCGGADILSAGVGTAAAMWAVGYLARMPGVVVPPWLLATGLAVCMLAGGASLGRWTRRGPRGIATAGALTACVNLLVLGSLLVDPVTGRLGPSALLWIAGTLLATVVLFLGGSLLSRVGRDPERDEIDWSFRLVLVTIAATGLLLVAGGLVTGRDAGKAVSDWPTSEGFNMFLYPLSRMTGNIYYEHAHRLYGALVGLATVILALHLLVAEWRRYVKWLGIAAVIAVICQGVLGGTRVTKTRAQQNIERIQAQDESPASQALRVTHGVVAQVFFAFLAVLAAVKSRAWESPPLCRPSAGADRALALALLALLLLQLLLGALVRHLQHNPLLHMSFAALVLFVAMAAGVRAWALYGSDRIVFRRLGLALVVAVTLQVGLGIGAVVATGLSPAARAAAAARPAGPGALAVTGAHHLLGAVLLAVSASLAMFAWRLLWPGPSTAAETGPPRATGA